MEQINKIKNHVKENKKVYIAAGVGLVVGASSVLLLRQSNALVNVRPIQLLTYKSKQTVEVYVEALGDPGNIVQDVTDGVRGSIYASQNQAANALGVDRSVMSRHLHGLIDSVKGRQFEVLGKAAVAE